MHCPSPAQSLLGRTLMKTCASLFSASSVPPFLFFFCELSPADSFSKSEVAPGSPQGAPHGRSFLSKIRVFFPPLLVYPIFVFFLKLSFSDLVPTLWIYLTTPTCWFSVRITIPPFPILTSFPSSTELLEFLSTQP